ncbi:scavenger receptor cysteine-rich domain-containing group B protein-like, partial [Poecilia latipinna]|uniref:scavenger receptor cysteine-rich domain-containing group B protein-like n=1 Tax=Poecilia latipinna TaxID=48699 RepID=UPI00072DA7F6
MMLQWPADSQAVVLLWVLHNQPTLARGLDRSGLIIWAALEVNLLLLCVGTEDLGLTIVYMEKMLVSSVQLNRPQNMSTCLSLTRCRLLGSTDFPQRTRSTVVLEQIYRWGQCVLMGPRDKDNLIRLSGSNEPCSGRVEIYHNGSWGTVCDDGWDLNDAAVACRQLGCGLALGAPQSAHFGEGTGQIWLDDVVCSGNESSLAVCGHNGFGTHNCGHHEDAGVICSNHSIRLSGSNEPCSGRVEIYHNGSWGTVCDDGWDLNDAAVACRQLDCGPALGAPPLAYFGQGTGQIWLDDLGCSGNESSLAVCGHSGFGTHDCGHGEDAGVNCS